MDGMELRQDHDAQLRLMVFLAPVGAVLMAMGVTAGSMAHTLSTEHPRVPYQWVAPTALLAVAAILAGRAGLLRLLEGRRVDRAERDPEAMTSPARHMLFLRPRIGADRQLRARLMIAEMCAVSALPAWFYIHALGYLVGVMMTGLIAAGCPAIVGMLALFAVSLSSQGAAAESRHAARRVALTALPTTAVLSPVGDILLERAGIEADSDAAALARELAGGGSVPLFSGVVAIARGVTAPRAD